MGSVDFSDTFISFDRHDVDGSGFIDQKEMIQVLSLFNHIYLL